MIETLVLTVGAFAAAIISGATGFGFALAGTALWSQALEPRLVAVLALVFTTILNIAYLPLFWRDIDLRRLAPFLIGSLFGVPLGAWTLGTLDSALLRRGTGLLLLAYGGYMLSLRHAPQWRLPARAGRVGDAVVGLFGGFFGGLGGLSGFLPALWCGLRGWDKSTNRGLVQGYILATNALSMAWVGRLVGVPDEAQGRLLLGLPFVAAGAWLGLTLFKRLNTAAFNRLVLWVITGCGALLLIER